MRDDRMERAIRAQQHGGPRIGKIPIEQSRAEAFFQDADYDAEPIWSHDGFAFEVLGAEPYRAAEGVSLLIVVPRDGGPHGRFA